MVLISHAHRLIFLTTRKTAGASMDMLLEGATGLGPAEHVECRAASLTDAGLSEAMKEAIG